MQQYAVYILYIYCSVHRNILWNNRQMSRCAVDLQRNKASLHIVTSVGYSIE